MAFEKLGVGGVFTFDDRQGVKAMGRTSAAFGKLQTRARGVQEGARRMGTGVRNVGITSVVAAAGVGSAFKSTMKFEKMMSAVGAVTNATKKELEVYRKHAIKMGIDTAFSATLSADAMRILGKMNLKNMVLMKAASGVGDLAAATNIDLATAADVAARSLNILGIPLTQTRRAADVLAEAARSTSTDVRELGEAFIYGGGTAKSMGMEYEQTMAATSLMAKAGLEASMAGTGLSKVLAGLQGRTPRVREEYKKLGFSMKDFAGSAKRLPEIIEKLSAAIKTKYKTPAERTAAAFKLFGERGIKAFQALAGEGGNAMVQLTDKLKKAGSSAKDKFGKPLGVAAYMARKQLDNVAGAMTLLKSSLEAFNIIALQTFLGPMKNQIKAVTKEFNKVLYTLQELDSDPSLKNQNKLVKKYGSNVVQVALGVRDAIQLVKNTFKAVGKTIQKLGEMIGQSVGKDTLRNIIKFSMAFVMILAALAPVFLALFGLKFLLGTIWSLGSGAFIAIKAAALPLVLVLGGIAAALLVLRNEGESLGETAVRVFRSIVTYGQQIYNNAILPLVNGIVSVVSAFTVEIAGFWRSVAAQMKSIALGVISVLKSVINVAITILKPVFSLLAAVLIKLRPLFMTIVKFILDVVQVVVQVAKAIMSLLQAVADFLAPVISFLKPIIAEIFGMIGAVVSALIKGIGFLVKVIGAILRGLIWYVKLFFKILTPIVKVLLFIGKVIWAIGKAIYDEVVPAAREFWLGIKEVGKVIWEYVEPAFVAIGKALGWIIGLAKKVGGAIRDFVMWPIKKMAGFLATVLRKMQKVAKYVPGLSQATLGKMAYSLEIFAGTNTRARAFIGEAFAEIAKKDKKAAEAKRKAETAKEEKIAMKLPPIELKNKISLKPAPTTIDGRCVAASQARHRVELQERAGFGTTPWQRRAVILRAGDVTASGQAK